MAEAWRALLLVVGLAVTACVAQRHQSYEEIVTQALHVFNYGQIGQPLFGLLEALPPPGSNSTITTPLSFRVKETVCLSGPQRQPQECAFRDRGEERNCTGNFLKLGHYRILAVDCPPSQKHLQEAFRRKRSAEPPETASPGIDSSKLPPVIRDMYDKAKYDIIMNILRNF